MSGTLGMPYGPQGAPATAGGQDDGFLMGWLKNTLGIDQTPAMPKATGPEAGYGPTGTEQTHPTLLGMPAPGGFDPAVRLGPGITTASQVGKAQDVASIAGNFMGTFGREGAAFPPPGLNTAKALEARGSLPRDIHGQTGWDKDANGNWRFEISDDQAKLNPLGLRGPVLDGVTGIQDYRWPIKANAETGAPLKLPDVMDHPELYRQYPELKDTLVTPTSPFASMNLNGAYYEPQNLMQLSGAKPEPLLSTALHEAQHGIQGIEDAPRGANSNTFLRPGDKQFLDDFAAQKKELQTTLKGSGLDYYEAMRAIKASKDQNTWKYLPDGTQNRYTDVLNKLDNYGYTHDLLEHSDFENVANNVSSNAYSNYSKTAGEVESRLVQDRQNMTPEQRATTFPQYTPLPEYRTGYNPATKSVGLVSTGKTMPAPYTEEFPRGDQFITDLNGPNGGPRVVGKTAVNYPRDQMTDPDFRAHIKDLLSKGWKPGNHTDTHLEYTAPPGQYIQPGSPQGTP